MFLPFNKKNLFLLIGLSTLITSFAVVLIQLLFPRAFSGPTVSSVPQPNTAIPTVQIAESRETGVDPSIVAKKVNLERKLFVPKTAVEKSGILAAAKEVGAVVVKSDGSSLVLQVPKEQEETFTSTLNKTAPSIKTEVDYPVYLQADSVGWNLQKIEAPSVWNTTRGSQVVVAVLDTGIDYRHPELQSRYAGGYDFSNDDPDPYDDNGHGTHVSGIAVASANNTGIQGVAAEARVLGVKVLGADGTGYLSDVVDGIDWAVRQGAQVINFSLGTTHNSSALELKLQEAVAKGVYLVASAGNTNGGSLLYPAAYTSVVSVSATDPNDAVASFSSLGAEVSAPGVDIESTIPGGGYARWSGTSMAAPHVTGAIALMIANKQTNIRERLRQSSVDLGPSGADPYYGAGRIWIKPAVLGEDTLAPVVTFLEPAQAATLSGRVRVRLSVQDEFAVTGATLSANGTILASWTTAPFVFDWNTDSYKEQEVTLIASAQDNSQNIGAAQLVVRVSASGSATPQPRRGSGVPRATASAFPRGSSRSGEVRQDINTPAMDRRQNLYRAPSLLPPVSNFNNRRQSPNPTPTPQPSSTPVLTSPTIPTSLPTSAPQNANTEVPPKTPVENQNNIPSTQPLEHLQQPGKSNFAPGRQKQE